MGNDFPVRLLGSSGQGMARDEIFMVAAVDDGKSFKNMHRRLGYVH
jgi:hypothetical protein